MTRANIEAQQARVRLIVDECISLLSLQPDDSPVHSVEQYGAGFCISVDVVTERLIIYALPWSRGWSVFTEESESLEPVGAYSWRDVPRRLQGLQRPLYAPRDVIGPDSITPQQITDAVLYIVATLTRLRDLRRRRIEAADRRAQTWYWPRSAAKASRNA